MRMGRGTHADYIMILFAHTCEIIHTHKQWTKARYPTIEYRIRRVPEIII